MSGGSAMGANLSVTERESRCCEKLFGEILGAIHLEGQNTVRRGVTGQFGRSFCSGIKGNRSSQSQIKSLGCRFLMSETWWSEASLRLILNRDSLKSFDFAAINHGYR